LENEFKETIPEKKQKTNNKITEQNKTLVSNNIDKAINKNKIIVEDDDNDGQDYFSYNHKLLQQNKVEEPVIKKAMLNKPKPIISKTEAKLVPVDVSNFFSNKFIKEGESKQIKNDDIAESDLMDVDEIDPPNTPKQDHIPIPKNASPREVIEKLTPIKEKPNDIELKKEEKISPIKQSTPKVKPKPENKPVQTKTEMRKEISQNNSLWTIKYNPKSIKDIIGNQSQVNKIIDWLNNWNDVVLRGRLRDIYIECKFN
jgi:hypothetical protein